jgi:flagellar hook-associated protein 3 FlgL
MIRIASSMVYQQAVSAIDQNQTTLSQVQEQMSSGLSMQTAADNPVAFGQSLQISQAVSDVSQWQSNATALSSSLGTENTALTSVSSALQQIRTLALEANNSTMSSSDRQTIAQQMQQQLDTVLQQANTQDANGNYIFGGTQSAGAPFTQTAGGATYNGNSEVNMISLGPTSELAAGDPGDAVFMQLQSGDGNISVSAAAGNAGTASISDAGVSNSGTYAGGSYSVQFSSASQYQVLDANGNVVSSGNYTSGTPIQFAGLSVTLNGTPAAGDSFSFAPSTAQSLFSGIQSLINAVSGSGGSSAQSTQSQTALYNGLQFLQGAQNHITNVLAGVGSRQQAVTSATSQLQDRSTQLQATLSSLDDVDYAQASAQFSQTQLALQAAEQSYVQIQGMSLFNYIK